MLAEPILGSIVGYQYDKVLIALSFLISVFGSYVALELASSGRKFSGQILGAAIALGGCAIWSMHFIGMAAYKTSLYTSYDLLPTLLSLIIAIAITAVGLWVAAKAPDSLANICLGGAIIGSGVVAMHYLGMLGMRLRASIDWDWSIIALSVGIAVVAATVAIWLAFNVKSTLQRLSSAVVMGVAVCAMHYTAMAAATFICIATYNGSRYGVDGPYLGYTVFFVALATLGTSMIFARLGQQQPELKAG
jgi:NO-binding membrane sensor protein with MHYT domain